MQNIFVPPIGTPGNAWNNVAVVVNGSSNVVDTFSCAHVSAYGNASAATTLTLQYSADGQNFYNAGSVTLAAAGNFYLDVQTAARYLRLLSSAAATLTATIQAKS